MRRQPHPTGATSLTHPQRTHLYSRAALRWFYLGVSAATMLQQPAGAPFLRALLQLLEEHQYHFSSSTVQNIKAIRARGASGQARSLSDDADSHKDLLKPTLQRVEGKVGCA